jgi:hypothetical protein
MDNLSDDQNLQPHSENLKSDKRMAFLDPITFLTFVTHVISPSFILLVLYYWLRQY